MSIGCRQWAHRFESTQIGMSREYLESAIGSRGRVADVLNRKRALTLPMIRELSELLELSEDTLVQPYFLDSSVKIGSRVQ